MDRAAKTKVRSLTPTASNATMTVVTMMVTMMMMVMMMVMMMGAGVTEGKTVVSIPFPFPSHTKYHTNVARQLSKRGHQVWVAISSHILHKDYLDTSGLGVIPYDTRPELESAMDTILQQTSFEKRSGSVIDLLHLCRSISDSLLRNESFVSTIGSRQPDLIIVDNLSLFYTMSIIPYRLGVPFAFVGSFYTPWNMGIPFSPAETAMALVPYGNNMSFFQRLHNTLVNVLFTLFNPTMPHDAVATYAPEMEYVPLRQLILRAEIFLVERDHVLDYPNPTMPNVKLIGATAAGPAKPLPPDYQAFVEGASDGVVVVSFGSYMLGLPPRISNKVFQALASLPFKSVFRSNLTSPDPEKIMTSSWIPQNDLLGHKKTKVFVSHCGKNGQYEALYHGVPVVATPLFVDQFYNAERARVRGLAQVLDINTCTAEELSSAILRVATEPRYKQAADFRSRLFRELYGVPTETAAYWLEHVMEYGGDYMRSAGQQMPWYQFLLLDVALFLLGLAVVCGVVLGVCLRAVCRCCCGQKKLKQQ